MAKVFQHQADGTWYTKRYEGESVTRRIHPDGVVFLKRRGVRIGEDIPPFAMSELVVRNWLSTNEEAAGWGEVRKAPEPVPALQPSARQSPGAGIADGETRLPAGPIQQLAGALPPRSLASGPLHGSSAVPVGLPGAVGTNLSLRGFVAVVLVLLVAMVLGMNLTG